MNAQVVMYRALSALVLAALLTAGLAGCGGDDEEYRSEQEAEEAAEAAEIEAEEAPTPPPNALNVSNYLYQLQGLDLAAVGATSYDLVIMDYSSDGGDEAAWTAEQIAALRASPGGPKILLAYISIGEAETYRYYWDETWDADGDGRPDPGAPSWLDEENPNWEGNYKVRYWEPGWQQIIFGYLDKILAAGFDGVYLDIIDGYEYYEEQGRESAAQEMVAWVLSIADYPRRQRTGVLMSTQSDAELAADFPEYLAAVDGIGQEDMYYGYDDDNVATPPDVVAEIEANLDLFVSAGKTVLLVAYTTDPAQIADHYRRARARGYVPFAAKRDLDKLTINPGSGVE